jgi:uncharacterized protein (TIRG00374 family)
MLKKHLGKLLIGCLFSAILIYLTLRQIDISASVEYVKNANYFILIIAACIQALSYVARSIRYFLLLWPVKKTAILKNFPYLVLGFFMNNLVPFRIGEIIRAKVTGERLGISRSSALATIAVERLLDIGTFILFFFLIMHFLSFPAFIKNSFYLCSIIVSLVFIIFSIASLRSGKALDLISKIPMPLKIKTLILSLADRFIEGLNVLKSKKILSLSCLFSIIIWLIESSILVIVAQACGFELSLEGAAFTVIIIGIGGIIPTAPGYIGTFEFMGMTALAALGIDKDRAFYCIAIYHFMQIIVISLLGISSILLAKISVKDLFKFEN